jgi:hypothetical protein
MANIIKHSDGRWYICGGNTMTATAARAECDKRNAVRPTTKKQFAKSKSERKSCHYCGRPAIGFGFFGDPICRECGG